MMPIKSNFKRRLIYSMLNGLFICCTVHAQKMKFTPLNMQPFVEKTFVAGKVLINKEERYLIEGYNEDSLTVKAIDDFVAKHKDTALNKYSNYNIIFYNKSDQTNVENINNNKRVIDRYSQDHDLIFSYFWYGGKFIKSINIKTVR